jgi:hypothetical protein
LGRLEEEVVVVVVVVEVAEKGPQCVGRRTRH